MGTNTPFMYSSFQNSSNRNLSEGWIPLKRDHPNMVITSKYTCLSFLPYNIIYQLSKGSTFFFFITLILLAIPSISPFEPWTYLIAFIIVVGVSMVKDGMEDYRRHQDDKIINSTVVHVLERTEDENRISRFNKKEKLCMDLEKGDWLYAEKNKELQADVVLMRSKMYHKDRLVCSNCCFIDTSNIDGESNLKKRNAITVPTKYPCAKKSTGQNESGMAEEPANSVCFCTEYFMENIRSFELKDTGDDYNEFECDINFKGHLMIANEKNTLMRGSILKNTESSLCLVVGVGEETKQAKSLYKSKKGKTLFDDRMNSILIIVLLLYAAVIILTAMVGALFAFSHSDSEYLNITSAGVSLVKLIFSNYVLYIYLIPLSLYVMLEIVRFIHAFYVKHDPEMVIENRNSVCRNANAIADLGFIDYILTDKTGTITKNAMTLKFVHLSDSDNFINPGKLCGRVLESMRQMGNGLEPCTKRILESNSNEDLRRNMLFIINMLACNSVEILNGSPEGISQEELCFLEAIGSHGFKLVKRDEEYVDIQVGQEKIRMDIIGHLEFSSKRQRMSMIYKIFGKYYLLTKGSDQKLLGKAENSEILKLINSFTDYRSLVLKFREIKPADIDEFKASIDLKINDNSDGTADEGINEEMAHHGNLMKEQKHREEESFKTLEKDTIYLGSVFIEDELQDEVQQTMKAFKEAGIKVWMITGDKKETAISCAKNSFIIEDDDYLALNGEQTLKMIERRIENNGVNSEEGSSLPSTSHIQSGSSEARLNSKESALNRDIFGCKSVIVYRATPSQKGKIASLMIKAKQNILSIGDGNNDVAMLKDSHVGVGIMGKEGTQAALSADFAIPQFKFLKNLIFIHGRYSLMRYTKLALNSYYKNIIFVFAQFLYNIYSGASGRPLYNSFVLSYYNLFFTSMIPFSFALFDRDVTPYQAMNQPTLYKNARTHFNSIFIYSNVIFALVEAAILFFVMKVFVINDITNGSGVLGGHVCISTIFSVVVIYTVVLRQIKMISFRVVYNDLAILLTVVANLLMLFWIQELYNKGNNTIYHLISMPAAYFIVFSVASLILVVDTIYDCIESYFFDKLKSKN